MGQWIARLGATGIVAAALMVAVAAGAGAEVPVDGGPGAKPLPEETLAAFESRSAARRASTSPTPPRFRKKGGVWEAVIGQTLLLVEADAKRDARRVARRMLNTIFGPLVTEIRVWSTSYKKGVRRYCGEGAVACYLPDDQVIIINKRSKQFAMDLTHELGHHVDGHYESDSPCPAGGDGTPGWYVSRGGFLGIAVNCIADPWPLDTGEIFAEDYAGFNVGLVHYHPDIATAVGAPTEPIFAAIGTDLAG